jgi:hypothetical protein
MASEQKVSQYRPPTFRSLAYLFREGKRVEARRLEIVIRNPGYEGTENALGAYTIDFEDNNALQAARVELRSKLDNLKADQPSVLFLSNEKNDELSVNLQYYVSHRILRASDFPELPWGLPPQGKPAPDREAG